MKALVALLCAGCLIVCAANASAQALTTLRIIENSAPLTRVAGKETPIDIDGNLVMNWDKPALLSMIAAKTGRTGQSPLADDLNLLRAAVTATLETQQRLVAYRVLLAAQQAEQASTDPAATNRAAALGPQAAAASRELGTAGIAMIGALRLLFPTHPDLQPKLNAAIRVNDDFQSVAAVLEPEVTHAQNLLADAIAQGGRVQLQMTATLVDTDGKATALHLDGYDRIPVGAPAPFARFNLSLDARALSEVQAAQAFVPAVTSATNGTAAAAVRNAMTQLPQALTDLAQQLRSGVVQTTIHSTGSELKMIGSAQAADLAAQFDQLEAALNGLDTALSPAGAGPPQTLTQTATAITAVLRAAQTDLAMLPARFEALTMQAQTIFETQKTATRTQLIATLNTSVKSFLAKAPELQGVVSNLQQASNALNLTSGLTNAADALTRSARTVEANATFDTALDLSTIAVERHPGDRVTLTVAVDQMQGDAPTFVDQDRITLRLEVPGWYTQTRGALLLVQPATTITRSVTFQPVPGIGIQVHHGAKNKPFLAHVLSPSVGVSLALLDFADGKDFELGIAANATALQDILWGGYGRNLQAQANYWYLGVNPLALRGLFGGK